jgi:hypothetical protein
LLLLVLVIDALALILADQAAPDFISIGSFGGCAARGADHGGGLDRASGRAGYERRRRYNCAWSEADRAAQGKEDETEVPGIIFLEIDGLALPVLRDAMRDGSAPTMARWSPRTATSSTEWETDLSPRPARARPASCSAPTRTSRLPLGREGDTDG